MFFITRGSKWNEIYFNKYNKQKTLVSARNGKAIDWTDIGMRILFFFRKQNIFRAVKKNDPVFIKSHQSFENEAPMVIISIGKWQLYLYFCFWITLTPSIRRRQLHPYRPTSVTIWHTLDWVWRDFVALFWHCRKKKYVTQRLHLFRLIACWENRFKTLNVL